MRRRVRQGCFDLIGRNNGFRAAAFKHRTDFAPEILAIRYEPAFDLADHVANGDFRSFFSKEASANMPSKLRTFHLRIPHAEIAIHHNKRQFTDGEKGIARLHGPFDRSLEKRMHETR